MKKRILSYAEKRELLKKELERLKSETIIRGNEIAKKEARLEKLRETKDNCRNKIWEYNEKHDRNAFLLSIFLPIISLSILWPILLFGLLNISVSFIEIGFALGLSTFLGASLSIIVGVECLYDSNKFPFFNKIYNKILKRCTKNRDYCKIREEYDKLEEDIKKLEIDIDKDISIEQSTNTAIDTLNNRLYNTNAYKYNSKKHGVTGKRKPLSTKNNKHTKKKILVK